MHPSSPIVAKRAALALAGLLLSVPASLPAVVPQVTVGTNLRVAPQTFPTTDFYNPGEPCPQVETSVAVNPTDPNNLVLTFLPFNRTLTETATNPSRTARRNGPLMTRSLDGGLTWSTPANFLGGINTRVAVSHTGRFVGVTAQNSLNVRYSTNKGQSWSTNNTGILWFDHPALGVDSLPTSPYAGYIYSSVPDRPIFMVYSPDGGATVLEAESTPNVWCMLPMDIETCNDGTAVMLYQNDDLPFSNGAYAYNLRVIRSTDGGRNWTGPHLVRSGRVTNYQDPQNGKVLPFAGGGAAMGNPHLAYDRTRDRLYCVWRDYTYTPSRAQISYSDDRGLTWSAHRVLFPDGPSWSWQYQVSAAVTPDGILGIQWFDTRNSPASPSSAQNTVYDLWFSASADGGQTFSAPVRVSTTSSTPRIDYDQESKPISQWVIPGFDAKRYMTGGDYNFLGAVSNSTFLCVWPDARHERTQQIYAARITVSLATTFASWILGHGLPLGQTTPAADPDRDGLANLLEYAVNGDPATPDHAAKTPALSSVSPLVFSFFRARPELIYEIQTSPDLAVWTTLATNPGQGGGAVSVPLGPGSARAFYRLLVSLPPTP